MIMIPISHEALIVG